MNNNRLYFKFNLLAIYKGVLILPSLLIISFLDRSYKKDFKGLDFFIGILFGSLTAYYLNDRSLVCSKTFEIVGVAFLITKGIDLL
jgi:hypothetical protein